MPYNDNRGHSWASNEPLDEDRCIRCGLTWESATGYLCEPGDVLSRPVPQHARPSQSVEAAVQAAPASPSWELIEKRLRDMFENDLFRIRTKFEEYGSTDLLIMGRSMETLLPGFRDLDPSARERTGIEMALGHYALGKASRLYGAWSDGKQPREDTWYDMYVYALMGRYVRVFGSWG
jgi:hypothetical protein